MPVLSPVFSGLMPALFQTASSSSSLGTAPSALPDLESPPAFTQHPGILPELGPSVLHPLDRAILERAD